MLANPATTQRHPAEAELLRRAVAGHPMVIESVLGQLSSANHWLQQIMLETMRDDADALLWQRLLECLALHRWGDYDDCERRAERENSERLDAALTRLFVEDEPESASTPVKLAVLQSNLTNAESRMRTAAAVVFGLRGDARGLEALIEAVQSGEPARQLLAMTALGKLQDERGGWALAEALACDDETVHWEASRALGELGSKSLPALLEALKSLKPHVRWHAVRALGNLNHPQSAAGLAETLADTDYSVRWAAADALINIGVVAVPKILERLSRYSPMDDTCQAAYHALHRIGSAETQKQLQPLLKALRGPAAPVEAPMVAYRLLQAWDMGKTPGER